MHASSSTPAAPADAADPQDVIKKLEEDRNYWKYMAGKFQSEKKREAHRFLEVQQSLFELKNEHKKVLQNVRDANAMANSLGRYRYLLKSICAKKFVWQWKIGALTNRIMYVFMGLARLLDRKSETWRRDHPNVFRECEVPQNELKAWVDRAHALTRQLTLDARGRKLEPTGDASQPPSRLRGQPPSWAPTVERLELLKDLVPLVQTWVGAETHLEKRLYQAATAFFEFSTEQGGELAELREENEALAAKIRKLESTIERMQEEPQRVAPLYRTRRDESAAEQKTKGTTNKPKRKRRRKKKAPKPKTRDGPPDMLQYHLQYLKAAQEALAAQQKQMNEALPVLQPAERRKTAVHRVVSAYEAEPTEKQASKPSTATKSSRSRSPKDSGRSFGVPDAYASSKPKGRAARTKDTASSPAPHTPRTHTPRTHTPSPATRPFTRTPVRRARRGHMSRPRTVHAPARSPSVIRPRRKTPLHSYLRIRFEDIEGKTSEGVAIPPGAGAGATQSQLSYEDVQEYFRRYGMLPLERRRSRHSSRETLASSGKASPAPGSERQLTGWVDAGDASGETPWKLYEQPRNASSMSSLHRKDKTRPKTGSAHELPSLPQASGSSADKPQEQEEELIWYNPGAHLRPSDARASQGTRIDYLSPVPKDPEQVLFKKMVKSHSRARLQSARALQANAAPMPGSKTPPVPGSIPRDLGRDCLMYGVPASYAYGCGPMLCPVDSSFRDKSRKTEAEKKKATGSEHITPRRYLKAGSDDVYGILSGDIIGNELSSIQGRFRPRPKGGKAVTSADK